MATDTAIHTHPLLDNLPSHVRDALAALEALSDVELRAIMDNGWPEAQSEKLAALRTKLKTSTLSDAEHIDLEQLRQDADLTTLRKAYAAVLLKWRGHPLPTLDELETQQ